MVPRLVLLCFLAMLIFAGGVALIVTAGRIEDHIIGVIAVLGAISIVVANVWINGKR